MSELTDPLRRYLFPKCLDEAERYYKMRSFSLIAVAVLGAISWDINLFVKDFRSEGGKLLLRRLRGAWLVC